MLIIESTKIFETTYFPTNPLANFEYPSKYITGYLNKLRDEIIPLGCWIKIDEE